MIAEKKIKKDLKDIRFYYENYKMFSNAARTVGENRIVKTVEKYNKAIEFAPPKLYKIYLVLYCKGATLKSVAYDLNYSVVYIEKLNKQLLDYLFEYFKTNGEDDASPFLNK